MAKSYKAKGSAIKIAAIEQNKSMKEVAREASTGYTTLINLSRGTQNTSPIRAKVISDVLGKKISDLFEEV